MGGANDAYLYNIGRTCSSAPARANKSLVFATGGTTQGTNERMRIDGSGDVGIAINNPTSILHVTVRPPGTANHQDGNYTALR